MSKIAEQIQKLKDQERHLERETRKVDFLTHILTSAQEYEHLAFEDIKDDVVSMLKEFVKKQIEAIEVGTEITITVGNTAPIVNNKPVSDIQTKVEVPKEVKTIEPSPAEKLNFALNNRHLAGKKVAVMNDKNIDIRGAVVGLDAPFILVKTETGPTIKVLLSNVVIK